MMSREFTRREKVLLLVLAVLVLGMTYYLLIHQPTTSQITEITAEQSQADSDLMLAQATHAQLVHMQEELAELAASGVQETEVPLYDNLQLVMNHLNEILAGTSDYSLSFQPVDLSEEFVRRTIQMTFSCPDYNQARQIITVLASGPYRCQIGDLQLSAGQQGSVSVTMSITYFEVQDYGYGFRDTADDAADDTEPAS